MISQLPTAKGVLRASEISAVETADEKIMHKFKQKFCFSIYFPKKGASIRSATEFPKKYADHWTFSVQKADEFRLWTSYIKMAVRPPDQNPHLYVRIRSEKAEDPPVRGDHWV